MPAPMIAPMPSETRLTAERLRLSGTPSWAVSACISGSSASASNAIIGLRAVIRGLSTICGRQGFRLHAPDMQTTYKPAAPSAAACRLATRSSEKCSIASLNRR